MKKLLLSLALSVPFMTVVAQTTVNDTVSVGAGYANQVWYSLENDEQGTQAKDNWDLAFDMESITSGIRINSAAGVQLWGYPKSDVSGYASVDTTGLSTWDNRWNSDTSWTYGAMGRYADPNNGFDLDWGQYDINTHKVLGDSIYIIQLVNGDFKKLVIESLSGGVYSFKYADLDGSNAQTGSVDKANFTNKQFGYFSLVSNQTVSREPDADAWDIVFGQYTGFVPIAYTVTGGLHARGVHTAKAENIGNVNTYNNYGAHTYSPAINTIGYNWKSFNGSAYDIADSTVYFVQPENGDFWKLVFTGFGGSSNGNIMFAKTKLVGVSVKGINGKKDISFATYPNPAMGQDVTVVYNASEDATITVYDMSGRTVVAGNMTKGNGLQQYIIPAAKLNAGMYIISVQSQNGRATQKLIVK